MVYDTDGRDEYNSCLERCAVATSDLHTAELCQPMPSGKRPSNNHIGVAALRRLSNYMNKRCVDRIGEKVSDDSLEDGDGYSWVNELSSTTERNARF